MPREGGLHPNLCRDLRELGFVLRAHGYPRDLVLPCPRPLEAAGQLSEQGIEAEVVDPRTLVPLDKQTILASVAKTGRLAVIDEANQSCSAASEIAAIVASEGFADLKGPIIRIARADVPIPFSPILEERLTVTAERIADAVAAGIAG